MKKASLMSRYANPGTPEYRQKRMCFSIFFRGCKLLKSVHTFISGTKIGIIRRLYLSLANV